jgi:chromosomal replication initiation ATPase DnaA
MKQEIFNQYVDRVVDLFGITKQELFSKNKKRGIVDARHLLYYLCYRRPMTFGYIQTFMEANGYNIKHSSIIHGVNSVTIKVKEDADYAQVVKDIEKAVFI